MSEDETAIANGWQPDRYRNELENESKVFGFNLSTIRQTHPSFGGKREDTI